MLDEIRCHDDYARILVIGHMPDVAELCLMLTGESDLPAMFVPATLVSLSLSDGWAEGSMSVDWMDTPVHISKRVSS